ncbi:MULTISPECIES: HEAT repeat domain-containing protein [Flavobacteriaceae]|uniref:HEAT repeat domain-containing protein n=1 Tax=Flavobacteriaceae TaxID=49546 RepID=UPI00234C0176|nr:hypothetical protein [Muricauda sp. SP22]MDC6364112.1 hypothetical protein [Muricauda sp. SP22]
MSPEYQELNKELEKLGLPNHEFINFSGVPIDTLVNTRISSKPYVEILLKYLPEVQENEKEMIVRALSEKGIKKVAPFLVQMFYDYKKYSELFLWAVGNTLCEIDDKESYPEIIKICKNSALGTSRQMLFLKTLPKIKNQEAYKVLLEGLADKKVRGHALDGLGKLGNTAAIGIIEKIEAEKGKYEFKAKERALRKLKKKNSGQQDV